jgi:hypothetical protein
MVLKLGKAYKLVFIKKNYEHIAEAPRFKQPAEAAGEE